jgi:hypothetical protein
VGRVPFKQLPVQLGGRLTLDRYIPDELQGHKPVGAHNLALIQFGQIKENAYCLCSNEYDIFNLNN